ncbi:MAG: hypothetical protein Kow0065_23970 [Methylomicrobium sp.]
MNVETLGTIEHLLLAVLVLLVLLWMGPGIRASVEKSKQAETDWPAVLVPLGWVAVLVFLLLMMV